jgi:acyl-CoA dehydrogenase
MPELLLIVVCVIGAFALGMQRAPLWAWTAGLAAAMLIWQTGVLHGLPHVPALGWLAILGWVLAGLMALLCVPAIRTAILVRPLYHIIKRLLPRVSETEKAALDAGTIGFDAELFSGQPDWARLRAVPPITLTEEEQAFLDGPTNELCRMANDWVIRHNEKEIPKEIWDFIKQNGFLGMLISKRHGGLGFSPQAQSIILGRIASRSPDVCTLVMVPNSLGPGELIEKYGTPEQKDYYLPRLAQGLEIPCFSLTGPTSGSDAATMRDVGYVTRGTHDGREVLGFRLSWEKRYITLGPNATLVGLAFRVFDPDNLLGGGDD